MAMAPKRSLPATPVAHTGSDGVYVYVFDYPAGDYSWRSVLLAPIFNTVTGLVVQDLDRNDSLDIAALVSTGDLYTFDGPTRTLRNLTQNPSYSLLSSQPKPSSLIVSDNSQAWVTFCATATISIESFPMLLLGTGNLDGVTVNNDGLWTGDEGVLTLRPGPSYGTVAWESPFVASGFGKTVATVRRNGQKRVFSGSGYAVSGFTYTTQ